MNNKHKRNSNKPHYHRSETEKFSESKATPSKEGTPQTSPKPAFAQSEQKPNQPFQLKTRTQPQSENPTEKTNKRRNWNKRPRRNNRLDPKPVKPANRIYNRKEKQEELVEEVAKGLLCPVCEKPIRNIAMAIRQKESEKLAHFDCVLKQMHSQYHSRMSRNRRIYYIGSGNFALVKEQYDKKGQLKSYRVLERIDYENADD